MPKVKTGHEYKKSYVEDDLQKALAEIANGMPIKQASYKFNVPRATIQFRMSSNLKKKSLGPSTILMPEEENILVTWLIENYKKGFPRRKEDVQATVQDFINEHPRQNPFTDNRPGEGWYKAFLKRHPELTTRTSEAITKASSVISEHDVKGWFDRIEAYLKQENLYHILICPDRILNGDETNFQLCPKNSKVLAPKGARNVYEVDVAPAKSSITVMFSFSASGDVTPPMIIYPYKRMPSDIIKSVPEDWGIGRSDNGWMKAELFYEYIGNVLHPYLQKKGVEFPVILFLDGHCTHLTYKVSKLCTKLNIILICLYPNSTRLLQPADVSVFKPLKNGWRKSVLEWRRRNPLDTLTKEKFACVLKEVVRTIEPETIKSGFRCCGLFPWNPLALDYSKCLGARKESKVSTSKTLSYERFVKIIGSEKITQFKNFEYFYKNDDFLDLYRIWKEFQSEECENTNSNFTENSTKESEENNDEIKYTAPKKELSTSMEKEKEMKIMLKSKETTNKDKHLFAENQNVYVDDLFTSTINNQIDNECKSLTTYLDLENIPIVIDNDNILQPIVLANGHPQGIEYINLSNFISWPVTPERKGSKNSEKLPFVLTSIDWQKIQEEKINKKRELELCKEERKRKRIEKKLANTKTIKNVKKDKKTALKKEETITSSPKIQILSYKTLSEENKIPRSHIRNLFFNNTNKTNQELLSEDDIGKNETKCKEDDRSEKKGDQNCSEEYSNLSFPNNIRASGRMCYLCTFNITRYNDGVQCLSCIRTYHSKCIITKNPELKADSSYKCC